MVAKFFNVGLDRTGLASFHNAMIKLGFRSAQHENWKAKIDLSDFFCGPPFLQRIDEVLEYCNKQRYRVILIHSDRPLLDWLESCRNNHHLQQNVVINEHRLIVYGSLTFDEVNYKAAKRLHDYKIAMLQTKYTTYPLPLQAPPKEKWQTLKLATGAQEPDYPHINRTIIKPFPYSPNELVA